MRGDRSNVRVEDFRKGMAQQKMMPALPPDTLVS